MSLIEIPIGRNELLLFLNIYIVSRIEHFSKKIMLLLCRKQLYRKEFLQEEISRIGILIGRNIVR